MQVHGGMSPHIVFLAGIGEEVGLGAGLHAGIKERQTVLRHYGIVVIACNDLQTAL